MPGQSDPGHTDASQSDAGPTQGVLFRHDSFSFDDGSGYRGPTACGAAGVTYRQLDYWARTG
ncbi:MAG: MerR family transcriptional regulator, partial [Ornithinimicrobium sp.]